MIIMKPNEIRDMNTYTHPQWMLFHRLSAKLIDNSILIWNSTGTFFCACAVIWFCVISLTRIVVIIYAPLYVWIFTRCSPKYNLSSVTVFALGQTNLVVHQLRQTNSRYFTFRTKIMLWFHFTRHLWQPRPHFYLIT